MYLVFKPAEQGPRYIIIAESADDMSRWIQTHLGNGQQDIFWTQNMSHFLTDDFSITTSPCKMHNTYAAAH